MSRSASIAARVARTLGASALALFARLPPSRVRFGVRIGAVQSAYPGYALHRIEEALGLLRVHDPAAFDRLTRHVRFVIVQRGDRVGVARGQPSGVCWVGDRDVTDAGVTVQEIASAFAREAMRLYLAELGLRSRPGTRARTEVLCAMAELAFAHALRDGEDGDALEAFAWSRVRSWGARTEASVEERLDAEVDARLAELGMMGGLLGKIRGWAKGSRA